uniref:Uncharacterized protein n=1 Tax=Knufia peltigerae TaxID=1002370 RepID=A0AA39CSA5_9EURO|nr:hypothetical protein H2204_012537 [Knufia peltigerae]
MSDSFTLGQFLLGLLLGVVIPLFAARLDREFARIGTLRPLPKLLLVTLWDILMSNIRVAIQVLGPEKNIHPGFIWLPLDIANIHGIAALTSMITLTPGTVSAALSDDRKFLLVHVLHLEDPQELIDTIKRHLPMTGFQIIQTTLVVCMHMVGLAMLVATWRLLRGPTVPDRILALDTLSVTAIAELMLFGMYLNSAIYFEAALIIAMLGFGSTVVLSKFVLRRDIIALSILLLFGCFFILVGALGLVKLSTFFKRLHAPTKASTLGVGCVLVCSVCYHIFLGQDPQPRELLITVFLFITAPISAHLMAKAALSLLMETRPSLPGNERAEEEQLPPPEPEREEETTTR